MNTRAVKESVLDEAELLFSRLRGHESLLHTANGEVIYVQFADRLVQSNTQDEIESIRLKRAKAMLALADISKSNARLVDLLLPRIDEARHPERSDNIRRVLHQASLMLREGQS